MTKAIPNIPRRCRVDLYSPGEIAIRQAMIVVEKMGAAVALTDAVILLSRAKDRVADFVDGVDLLLVGKAAPDVNKPLSAAPASPVVENWHKAEAARLIQVLGLGQAVDDRYMEDLEDKLANELLGLVAAIGRSFQ